MIESIGLPQQTNTLEPVPEEINTQRTAISESLAQLKIKQQKPNYFKVNYKKFISALQCLVENKLYIGFMSFLTIYVLFIEDVRLLVIPKALDSIFMFFNCISLFLFLSDLVISSLAINKYFLGFYFWLDLIGTVSLISDITWIWYRIIGVNTSLLQYVDNNGNFDP